MNELPVPPEPQPVPLVPPRPVRERLPLMWRWRGRGIFLTAFRRYVMAQPLRARDRIALQLVGVRPR
jgi:hypothetical protein